MKFAEVLDELNKDKHKIFVSKQLEKKIWILRWNIF